MTIYIGPSGASLDHLDQFTAIDAPVAMSLVPDDDAPVRTIPACQTFTTTFTAKGAASRRAMRVLFGLPYKHPRQILHNGRKPR